MIPCTNLTDLTLKDGENFFFIEGEEFDRFLLFKILQLVLYSIKVSFRLTIDFRIFYEILSKDQLQTSANVAIFAFLVSDLIHICHHAFFACVVLIKEKLWIYMTLGEMEAFLNAFFGIFNFLCLTVMTLEKVLYTKFPFKHLSFFSVKKTIFYICLCTIPTGLYCIGIHVEYHVHYISNTLSMFYCFHTGSIAIRHIFWVIPVLFIIIIVLSHASILVNLCYNRCHVPQHPGFTLDLMDGDFIGRFVKAVLSVVLLTTSVFVDLMLRVLFQYIRTPVHINRSIWVLCVMLRMLNPLIILGGNGPLRNYVYNTSFQRSPSWLAEKKFQIDKKIISKYPIPEGLIRKKVRPESITGDECSFGKGNSNEKSTIKTISSNAFKNMLCISKETPV